MVIQANMSPEAIVDVWSITADIFGKYNMRLTKQTLAELAQGEVLNSLLHELNSAVGSSALTCIEGG